MTKCKLCSYEHTKDNVCNMQGLKEHIVKLTKEVNKKHRRRRINYGKHDIDIMSKH